MPKISIIIPTYNEAGKLGLLLESIKKQEGCELEVVIIDNDSTDNTERVVSRCGIDNVVYVKEPDKGIYDAMNKGVKRAQSPWIMFMGADDVIYNKDVLKDISTTIENSDECKAIFGDIIFDNGKIRSSEMSKKILFINTIHHQSSVYSKSLFNNFKYNYKYKISSDYELNLVMYLEKIKTVRINKIVSKVSLGGASDKVNCKGYLEEIYIRNKHIDSFVLKIIANTLTIIRFIIKFILLKFSISLHYYNR